MGRLKITADERKAVRPSQGFGKNQVLLGLLFAIPFGVVALALGGLLLKRFVFQPQPAVPTPREQPSPRDRSTTIQPLPPAAKPADQSDALNEASARAIVEEWLTVKSQIFAPPFNTALADQVVADGPLWTDLTKPDGSIQWLKKNNSYYSYAAIRVNRVVRFLPSVSMPSIVVSVTENSTMHSPKGKEESSSTNNWIYTLKKEGDRWKIWDYRKQ